MRFQKILTENTNKTRDQAEVEKIVKQFQVIRVDIEVQRP